MPPSIDIGAKRNPST